MESTTCRRGNSGGAGGNRRRMGTMRSARLSGPERAAARLSSSCAIVVAPMITDVTTARWSSQAIAICATETPRASAIPRITSTQAKARGLSTGGKSRRRHPWSASVPTE